MGGYKYSFEIAFWTNAGHG